MIKRFPNSGRGRDARHAVTGVSMALAAVLGVCALLPGTAGAAAPRPVDIRHVVVHGGLGHTVHWQARTCEPGGSFHLYAGARLDALRLIDVQSALPGIGQYRHRAHHHEQPQVLYQLLYVGSDGSQVVLGTLALHQERVDPMPASIDSMAPVVKGVPASEPGQAQVSTWLAPAHGTRLPRTAAPQPEVPPPRSA